MPKNTNKTKKPRQQTLKSAFLNLFPKFYSKNEASTKSEIYDNSIVTPFCFLLK